MLFDEIKTPDKIRSDTSFICNTKKWTHNTNPVLFVACNFDLNNFDNSLFFELDIDCPVEIINSVVKRKAEFLAGRYAAKLALQQNYNKEVDLPAVYIGNDRQPIWPRGIVGSITHNSSQAIVGIGSTSHIKYLGIDIENILSLKSAQEISYQICDRAEIRTVMCTGLKFDIAITLIFSAKESLYKALYPN